MTLGIIGGISALFLVVFLVVFLIIRAMAHSSATKRTNWANNANSISKEIEARYLEIIMDGIENGEIDKEVHMDEYDKIIWGKTQQKAEENHNKSKALCEEDEKILSLIKKQISIIPNTITENGKLKIKTDVLQYISREKFKEIGGW